MKERPIIFSGPMVRALLEGRKNQTRRIVKPPRGWEDRFPHVDPWCLRSPGAVWWWDGRYKHTGVKQDCPYGNPGDRLWVRENWRTYASLDHVKPSKIGQGAGIEYPAGGSNVIGKDTLHAMGKLRPSIFLPRWASRILLELTEIRVERLQDISEEDAKAEGVVATLTCRTEYRDLWESINGAGSWDKNPFVWVIEFRRVQP